MHLTLEALSRATLVQFAIFSLGLHRRVVSVYLHNFVRTKLFYSV